jgi:UDP:flavonoid glycosyltransferase YjiC (YdhE family)
MRKKAILAWELGYGLGHIGVLSPVAERLNKTGWDCILAGHIDHATRGLVPTSSVAITPPPLLTVQRNSASYAELLYNAGFHNPIAALAAVKGWLSIFDKYSPSVLVADLAPFAILAARIAGLPVVITGSSFNLPPPISPQPYLRAWDVAASHVPIRKMETAALQGINTVLSFNNRKAVETVFEMYDHATPVLCTYAALDHFDRNALTQPVAYCGPIRVEDKGCSTPWPDGSGPKVFVHLKNSNSNTGVVMGALAKMGCRTLAYIPNHPKAFNKNQLISNVPFNLLEVAFDADLAITQGNLSTSLFFIERGVYVISSPEILEQALSAQRIAKMGFGSILANGSGENDAIKAIAQGIETHPTSTLFRKLTLEESVNLLIAAINQCAS